jgi:hypothetical protein
MISYGCALVIIQRVARGQKTVQQEPDSIMSDYVRPDWRQKNMHSHLCILHQLSMGIKNLSKLISDHASGAVREQV